MAGLNNRTKDLSPQIKLALDIIPEDLTPLMNAICNQQMGKQHFKAVLILTIRTLLCTFPDARHILRECSRVAILELNFKYLSKAFSRMWTPKASYFKSKRATFRLGYLKIFNVLRKDVKEIL